MSERNRKSGIERQFEIMQLVKEGAESQTEIAALLDISQGAVGQYINRLIKAGYIIHEVYRLSPKGMAMLELLDIRKEIEKEMKEVQTQYPRDGFVLGHERGLMQTRDLISQKLEQQAEQESEEHTINITNDLDNEPQEQHA